MKLIPFFIKTLLISIALSPLYSAEKRAANTWIIDSQQQWQQFVVPSAELEIEEGLATPKSDSVTIRSHIKTLPQKAAPSSIVVTQSPIWQNWQEVPSVGPRFLNGAPVALALGKNDYWMFGKQIQAHQSKKLQKINQKGGAQSEPGQSVKLKGHQAPLITTTNPHEFNAVIEGADKDFGYHAWKSTDMLNWVHYGPVTSSKGKWMTSAEYSDGKFYFYYDFPNDQDPHLVIDDNLFDGKVGNDLGMVFEAPSHGSDCAVIRDLSGNFHLISEDWSCINANARSWDSPLASHAISSDGIKNFSLHSPAVDYRTQPTGEFLTFTHPHWAKEAPEKFKGVKAKYEVHHPEQDAYGDWAAISIGGQYYLFGDFDPAGAHGKENMSVAWFTASDINKEFKFCDSIGSGHPDPDIMFAEGQFYLITQTDHDYISPGPWVESVEVRVGVDTSNDGLINTWSDWHNISEQYDYVSGFAKQVTKTEAQLDLSNLPAGFGFQFEMRLIDSTDNASKPIIDKIYLSFQE